MESILVSVIMANYKTKIEYLQEAIDSILNQTYRNFELIIIDDCSQDESVDYIKSINDNRVRLLINDKNSGPAVTRNRGLEVARGKYIAIMDSDDISLPTRLEKQVEFMENNSDVIVCGTWFEKFGITNMVRKPFINDFENYRCQLLFSNTPIIICHSSAMIRKSFMDKYHICYDYSLPKAQDYGLWVVCSKYARMYILNEVLVKYRNHSSQISTATSKEQIEFAYLVSRRQLQELGIDYCDEEKRWRYSQIIDKADLFRFDGWLSKIKEKNESKKIYNNVALERYLDLMLNRAIHKLNIFNRISSFFDDQNIRSFFYRKVKEKIKRKNRR